MISFDTSILLPLFAEDAPFRTDPGTGKPTTYARERLRTVIAQATTARTRVVVPTPVITELLVKADQETASAYLDELTRPPFSPGPFDVKAAVLAAELVRVGDEHRVRDRDGERDRVRYDAQIVAIARSRRVDTLYTDDTGMRTLAEQLGLTAVSTWDIPIPESARQPELALEDPEPPAGEAAPDDDADPGSTAGQ